MADTQPAIVNIDSNGDVILAVGEPVEKRLLVSSAMLSRASKVFATLFGPRFREGQGIGESGDPKTITLVEDNPTAISDICHLLHGEDVEAFSGSATAARILSFAIAVDKYDCLKPLRLHGQGILLAWLDRNRIQTVEGAEEGRIMAAAYLLEQRRAFFLITQRLMQAWNGNFEIGPTIPHRPLLTKEEVQLLPVNALYAMEQSRTMARLKIGTHLISDVLFRKCGGQCDDPLRSGSNVTLATVTAVTGIDPWPPKIGPGGQQTILSIAETLESRPQQTIISSCVHRRNVIVAASDFRSFARDLKGRTEGLCLDCMKEGAISNSLCCKPEHGYIDFFARDSTPSMV